MVLAQMVGKKRPFVRGLLLTVFTVGIYGIYWLFKAHDEVYKQFELQREGREEGVQWLVLGRHVLFPLQLLYCWMFVGNVEYVRRRLNLPAGITPGAFIALLIGGYVALFAGYVYLATSVTMDEDATPEEVAGAFAPAFGGFLLMAGLAAAIQGIGYYRLQSGINSVWDAYQDRMRTLAAAPGGLPVPGAAPALVPGAPVMPEGTPQFTYWGDLRPPQGASGPILSATHVRARAESVARDNPGLVLPPGFEEHLSRGEAGDVAALTAAAGLLDGVDRLLGERARLAAELEELERRQGRLAGRLANGEVDNAAYATARAELDRERARVQARLAEAEARLYAPSQPGGPPPS